MELEIYLDKTVEQNAEVYFETMKIEDTKKCKAFFVSLRNLRFQRDFQVSKKIEKWK
ncbi:MAG: hypothetical protein KAT77_00550 [Nanoarchaeota archaeon]|nr:hypothetical protein [Nanoarchaeota archaeon]